MDTIQPDLKWYTEISAQKNQPSSRCPFASVHRCPRYYASLSVLGKAGVATSLEPAEDERLLEKWKRTDLWPATDEQDTGIMGTDHYHNFCPEVSYERFGWFASILSGYADEIDNGSAHARLGRDGATAHDWRWAWASVSPMHYTECPLYSALLLGVNDIGVNDTKPQIGFSK